MDLERWFDRETGIGLATNFMDQAPQEQAGWKPALRSRFAANSALSFLPELAKARMRWVQRFGKLEEFRRFTSFTQTQINVREHQPGIDAFRVEAGGLAKSGNRFAKISGASQGKPAVVESRAEIWFLPGRFEKGLGGFGELLSPELRQPQLKPTLAGARVQLQVTPQGLLRGRQVFFQKLEPPRQQPRLGELRMLVDQPLNERFGFLQTSGCEERMRRLRQNSRIIAQQSGLGQERVGGRFVRWERGRALCGIAGGSEVSLLPMQVRQQDER